MLSKLGHARRCSQATVRRPQILKEAPDITFGEIGKQMGAERRGMTDAKKKPCNDNAEGEDQVHQGQGCVRCVIFWLPSTRPLRAAVEPS
jgi:hypothetical protein